MAITTATFRNVSTVNQFASARNRMERSVARRENCYGRTRNGSAARIQRSKPATFELFIFIWCHCEPALAWFMWCERRHGLYFIILRAVMTRGPTALITGRGRKFVVESSSSSVWCGFRALASQSHSAGSALSAPSAVIRFILKAVNVSSPSTEIYWKKCKKSVRRRCWLFSSPKSDERRNCDVFDGV